MQNVLWTEGQPKVLHVTISDDHRRIKLAGVGAFGMLATAISSTIIGPSLPFIKEDLTINLFWLGIIGGAWYIGYLFTFVGGVLADKYGHVATLTASLILVLSGLAMTAISQSYTPLILFLVMTGLGAGFVESTASSIVSKMYSKKPWLAMNLLHSFWGIGAAIGPGIAWLALASFNSWRYAYATSALTYMPLIICTLLCLRHTNHERQLSEPIVHDPPTIFSANSKIVLLGLSGFFTQAVEVGINVWLPSFLILTRNVSLRDASLALGIFYASMVIGRIGLAKMPSIFHYRRTMIILVILLSVSVFFAVSTDIGFFSIGFWALSGLFLGPLFPTLIAWVNSINPKRSGLSTGIMFTMGLQGGVLSSWVIGAVADLTSLVYATYLLLALAPLTLICMFVNSDG
jgi:fucose permease